MLSIGEIITMTGLDEATVHGSLDKLVSLGLAEVPPSSPTTTRKSMPPVEKSRTPGPDSIPPRPITEVFAVTGSGAPKPKPALYDPAELDEDVDLDLDHRRRVLDTFYQLGDLDSYEVLGIGRTADRKTIKRAYFESSRRCTTPTASSASASAPSSRRWRPSPRA